MTAEIVMPPLADNSVLVVVQMTREARWMFYNDQREKRLQDEKAGKKPSAPQTPTRQTIKPFVERALETEKPELCQNSERTGRGAAMRTRIAYLRAIYARFANPDLKEMAQHYGDLKRWMLEQGAHPANLSVKAARSTLRFFGIKPLSQAEFHARFTQMDYAWRELSAKTGARFRSREQVEPVPSRTSRRTRGHTEGGLSIEEDLGF